MHLSGLFVALGCMGFASSMLLNLSLRNFDPGMHKGRSALLSPLEVHGGNPRAKLLRRLRDPRTWTAVLLSVAGSAILLAAESVPMQVGLAAFLVRLGCAGHAMAAAVTHVLNGKMRLRGYRIFMPFQVCTSGDLRTDAARLHIAPALPTQ